MQTAPRAKSTSSGSDATGVSLAPIYGDGTTAEVDVAGGDAEGVTEPTGSGTAGAVQIVASEAEGFATGLGTGTPGTVEIVATDAQGEAFGLVEADGTPGAIRVRGGRAEAVVENLNLEFKPNSDQDWQCGMARLRRYTSVSNSN